MKLSNVLASVATSDKTASAPSTSSAAGGAREKTASTGNTGDRLREALKEATTGSSVASLEEKRASTASPVGDLMKTAAAVATAEHEALVKEAHLYGMGVADGFIARLAQHNEALEKLTPQSPAPQKTAAAADDSFEKFASENPVLVKEAAELGFATTLNQMDKLAGVAYETGYNQAVETVYKFGHQSFVQGFEDVSRILTERR